ncbi:MAG: hypothetical protein P9M06_00985 [Candidatus Saelkia tenebricola]|nr:hypothetical protein [Candidatus Saelkia tenebricola]
MVKDMNSEWINKILAAKISRKDFLVLGSKLFILVILLSHIPLRWIRQNAQPLKMKVKQFKEKHLFQQHNLAG